MLPIVYNGDIIEDQPGRVVEAYGNVHNSLLVRWVLGLCGTGCVNDISVRMLVSGALA